MEWEKHKISFLYTSLFECECDFFIQDGERFMFKYKAQIKITYILSIN